jgi:hypothetical protein
MLYHYTDELLGLYPLVSNNHPNDDEAIDWARKLKKERKASVAEIWREDSETPLTLVKRFISNEASSRSHPEEH